MWADWEFIQFYKHTFVFAYVLCTTYKHIFLDSHLDQLTDQEFNDVLLHYYDAYLDYLEKGELPENLGGNAQ